MPISEFQCLRGHKTEKLFLNRKKFESTETIICPKCPRATRAAYRVHSAPAVVGVKLQGWNEGEVKHIQNETLKIMAKEEKLNAGNKKRRR